MYAFPDIIKNLRTQAGLTQSDLAKRLSITRSSVNGWEMGLSAPSIPLIVELSKLFHVTTDYLLGLDDRLVIRTDGLNAKQISAVLKIIDCFNDE
ncbi:MAG: helix-turn-helix transcriptional regulator [Oscillospiraceae bacterium]|nr:helix-turn-helix transcriptional regulator [Oscillospiraceae bacterium]